jgi:hypothetical protein
MLTCPTIKRARAFGWQPDLIVAIQLELSICNSDVRTRAMHIISIWLKSGIKVFQHGPRVMRTAFLQVGLNSAVSSSL